MFAVVVRNESGSTTTVYGCWMCREDAESWASVSLLMEYTICPIINPLS